MQMEEIYEEYYHMVYGYLIGLTGGDRELSEELTQETFYRAVKNIHKFRGDATISTWLCQIAKYAFYQYIDKKRHGEILGKSENWARVTYYRAKQMVGKELRKNGN